MMKQKLQMNAFASIVLLLLFAICMLMTLSYGAVAYKNISISLDKEYGQSTALSYIAAKVRHGDVRGQVYLTMLNNTPALAIDEKCDGFVYMTYIYSHNGDVYELFCDRDAALLPDDGTKIVADRQLSFSLDDKLLVVLCTDQDGVASRLMLSLKSGGVK